MLYPYLGICQTSGFHDIRNVPLLPDHWSGVVQWWHGLGNRPARRLQSLQLCDHCAEYNVTGVFFLVQCSIPKYRCLRDNAQILQDSRIYAKMQDNPTVFGRVGRTAVRNPEEGRPPFLPIPADVDGLLPPISLNNKLMKWSKQWTFKGYGWKN